MKRATLRIHALTALFALAVVVASTVPAPAEPKMRIHGSAIAIDSLKEHHKDGLESAIGRPIAFKANGAGNGLIDVASGRAQAGLIAGPLPAVRARLDSQSPGIWDGEDLRAFPVGSERALFIVHRSNPVERLSADQLRAIFTGRITNWREVGGRNMLISVYATREGDDARTSIEETFLRGEPITNTARTVNGSRKLIRTVRHRPDAISFGNAANMDGHVRAFPDIRIEQPLFIVTRGEPAGDVRRLIDGIVALGAGF